MNITPLEKKREVWIDWMRVIACFLVLVVHSVEPFYLGGEGSQMQSGTEAVWAAVFLALSRACVALFVVASAYLQFPLHYDTGTFLKRRAVRILVPSNMELDKVISQVSALRHVIKVKRV